MKKVLLFSIVLCFYFGACSDDDDYTVDTINHRSPPTEEPQKPTEPEEQQGDGSSVAPYLIRSANDWCTYLLPNAKNKEKYYKISSSFKFSTACVVDTFCGVLNGNGKSIVVEDVPLFKVIDGACVRDLQVTGTIDNIGVKNYVGDYFGVIACKAIGKSRIVNCTSSTTISLTDNNGYLAGVCGHLSNAIVDSCSNYSSINKMGGRAAGITVLLDTLSKVTNSCSLASIKGTNLSLGGIAYRINGTVQNSYVYANLSGGEVGGVALSCKGGCIDNCYYSGTISGSTSSKSAIVGSASLGAVVRFCYYKCNDGINAVNQYENGGTVEYCYKMLSNTTLEKSGYYGTTGLVNELNSRCSFISGARQWKQLSGVVSFN